MSRLNLVLFVVVACQGGTSALASDELFSGGIATDVSAEVSRLIAEALREDGAPSNDVQIISDPFDQQGCIAGGIRIDDDVELPPGTEITNIVTGSAICVEK